MQSGWYNYVTLFGRLFQKLDLVNAFKSQPMIGVEMHAIGGGETEQHGERPDEGVRGGDGQTQFR